MKKIDNIIRGMPSNQKILDIFKGMWVSNLPSDLKLITGGVANLFEDDRITMSDGLLGGFENLDILELCPIEGGNSYMLQKRKVRKVTAITPSEISYLKCLCVKEMLGLTNVDFLLGDFFIFLRNSHNRYDVALVNDILYRTPNPVYLIDLLSRVAENIILWTHYFDLDIVQRNPSLRKKFGDICYQSYADFNYTSCSCSDPSPYSEECSLWLTKESLVSALCHFGYNEIRTLSDDKHNPNGPALFICAKKES
mgnify:CR=1 FL=1